MMNTITRQTRQKQSQVSSRAILAILAVSASIGVSASATAQVNPQQPVSTPSASNGGSQVQEVVVTAQKRSENLQDVPLSVSVANAQLLQDANVRNISDLQELVPGLVVVTLGNELNTTASIRGIGTASANLGLEDSVGIQVDGVYRPRNGVSFGDIGDLSQVEVLKGPQGTLFGKNTDAGLINIVTASPSYQFGAHAEFTAGNYNETGGSAEVTGPLIKDKLAGSLFFVQRSRDGFYNVSTGAGPRTSTSINDENFYSLRGQLAADPVEGVHARFIVDYTRRREDCCAGLQTIDGPVTPILQSLGVPGGAVLNPPNLSARQAFINRSTTNNVEDAGVSLQVDYTVPGLSGGKITSITAYREFSIKFGEDSDFTAADLLYRPNNGDSGAGFKQFSQELRLGGAYGKLDYDIGGFYANELLNSRVSELFGANFPQYLDTLLSGGKSKTAAALQPLANFDSNGLGQKDDYNQNDRTFSFFTQETYHLTSRLELTGGVRFTQDHKALQASYTNTDGGDACKAALLTRSAGLIGVVCNALYNPLFDGVQNRQAETENALTGTAKIGFHITPKNFAYASYARGYKSGGYNLDRIAEPYSAPGTLNAANSLKPVLDTSFPGEFVDSYEIGLKNTLFQRRLDLNVAVFYSSFSGFQLNAYNGVFFTVVSVPTVIALGADFDLLYRPTRNLTLQGGLTYANSRFPLSDSSVLGTLNNAAFSATNRLPGERLPEAPLVSINASVTYDHPLSHDLVGRGNIDVKYNSSLETGTNGDPQEVQGQYAIVDARLGIGPSDKRWSLEIYAKNLFDKVYSVNGFGSPLQSGSETAFPGDPRTFGGTIRVRY